MPGSQPPAPIAARALLDELVRLGVRHLVLAPGSRSAPLAYAAEALDREGRLTLHVRVDERTAAFLALGLAKTTRVPAAVVTTSGTAVANLHPAVLEADHGQVPLLLLTADRPPELRGVGANQATEQVSLFGASGGAGAAERCRLVVDVETPSAERLPEQVQALRTTAARAVAAARGLLGGTPGPVHLNLPYRDPLLGPSDGAACLAASTDEGGDPVVQLPADQPPVPPAAAGNGWTTLPTDPGTLVLVGDLPTAAHRHAAFAWAAHHGLPVLAEPGAPPEPAEAPVLMPHGTLALRCTSWLEQHRPERVVVVGRPTLGRAVPALVRATGEVHLVTDRTGWADPTHAAASVHPFAALARSADHPFPPTPWLRSWQDLGERIASAVRDHLDAEAARPPGGIEVARAVEAALPEGARLFLGSSSVARDHHLGVGWPRADVDVVASRGLAGIDGCISTAAGLSLAEPDRPTYAVLGDLTFLHDSGGLVVGPREPVPDLTIVVVDDDGGSIFTTLEYGEPGREEAFGRVFATPTGTDLVALARAHGVDACRVTDLADLPGALVQERGAGVRVVVVPVELSTRRAQGEALTRAVSGL